VAALGFPIGMLLLATVSFTCFAACRAQRHKVFKIMAVVFLCAGLVCALIPVGLVVWALILTL
jgi:hypothetical protein